MTGRKTLVMVTTLGLGAANLAPVIVIADEDFSRLSNEKLVQVRTQVPEISEADQARFRTEMQQDSQAPSMEERQSLGPGSARRGSVDDESAARRQLRSGGQNEHGESALQRDRQRLYSGDRFGQGYEQRDRHQSRAEQGADRGRGELQRDRQRAGGDRGYGRGYESRRSGETGGGRQGDGGRRGGG
jgi:hypothetical protein